MAHHCYLSCIFLIAYRTLISECEPRGDEPQPSSQYYGAYSSDGIGLASIWVGELQLDLDLDPDGGVAWIDPWSSWRATGYTSSGRSSVAM